MKSLKPLFSRPLSPVLLEASQQQTAVWQPFRKLILLKLGIVPNVKWYYAQNKMQV